MVSVLENYVCGTISVSGWNSGTATSTQNPSYDYQAFGEAYNGDTTAANTTMGTATTIDNRYTYTRREKNGTSGYQYNRYRHYDSRLDRWFGRDPIGYQNNALGNLYDYVYSMPISFIDVYGLMILIPPEVFEGAGLKFHRVPPHNRAASELGALTSHATKKCVKICEGWGKDWHLYKIHYGEPSLVCEYSTSGVVVDGVIIETVRGYKNGKLGTWKEYYSKIWPWEATEKKYSTTITCECYQDVCWGFDKYLKSNSYDIIHGKLESVEYGDPYAGTLEKKEFTADWFQPGWSKINWKSASDYAKDSIEKLKNSD